MKELMRNDLQFVLSRTPRDVRKLLQENRLFLAGGFIRATIAGEKPSDVDLLGGDKLVLENLALKLTNERKGRSHKTDNAITVIAPPRIPVQFILRWIYDDPEKLISEFDFTVVQAAIWWEPSDPPKDAITDKSLGKWRSMCADDFYPDLAARRLTYTHPIRHEDAGGSLLRVIKYMKRGYTIQAPSIAGVIARLIGALNLDRMQNEEIPSTVQRSFQNTHGTEDGIGKFINEEWATPLLLALLREVDPLVVIDGLDFIDEHQVV